MLIQKGEPVFIDGIANVDFGDDIRVQNIYKSGQRKGERPEATVAQVFCKLTALGSRRFPYLKFNK